MRIVAISLATAALAVAAPAFAAGDAGAYAGIAITHDSVNGTGTAEGLGFDGVGGSAFLGYNLPVSNAMFAGVEANFDLASADIGDKTNGVKADHKYGVSGRLGYKVSEGAAFYGKVGYQRGRLSDYTAGVQTTSSRDGLLLGAGVEADLSSNVAMRLEYSRTRFNRDAALDPVGAGLSSNQAAVGVQFKF
jgi:outer membrane immunogenic protein